MLNYQRVCAITFGVFPPPLEYSLQGGGEMSQTWYFSSCKSEKCCWKTAVAIQEPSQHELTKAKTTHTKGTASEANRLVFHISGETAIKFNPCLQSQCPTSKSSEPTIYTTAIITVLTVFPHFLVSQPDSQLYLLEDIVAAQLPPSPCCMNQRCDSYGPSSPALVSLEHFFVFVVVACAIHGGERCHKPSPIWP